MNDAIRTTAQHDASFWYPAVSEEELSDESTLVRNYRLKMAQMRFLSIGSAVVGVGLLVNWIRKG